MSIVGPRPPLPREVDLHEWHLRRACAASRDHRAVAGARTQHARIRVDPAQDRRGPSWQLMAEATGDNAQGLCAAAGCMGRRDRRSARCASARATWWHSGSSSRPRHHSHEPFVVFHVPIELETVALADLRVRMRPW